MQKLIFSLFISLLFINNGFACPYLEKASAILEKVNSDNLNDLNLLRTMYSSDKVRLENFSQMRDAARESVRRDEKILASLKARLGLGGTHALRSSLTKLVGSSEVAGILSDADSLLGSSNQWSDLSPELQLSGAPEGRWTVLKTALLYLNLTAGTLNVETAEKALSIVYPEMVPLEISQEMSEIPGICRRCENGAIMILIPNSGYIFGGTFFGDHCRGADCSSFASKCVNCSERLSTMHMALVWRMLSLGEEPNDPTVTKVASDFLPISPENKESILPGDLVIWRTVSGGGHVAIFKEWTNRESGEFKGIDDNRTDDKLIEGIRERMFTLYKPERQTYILRRI